MAPPARRRQFDSEEDLLRKIQALSVMGAPPMLDEPRLDAISALRELELKRERDNAPPPIEDFSKEPEVPPPPSRLAKEVEPTVEQLEAQQQRLNLPDLPVQKPLPPKPNFGPGYVPYQRDDNPPPEPLAPPPPEPEPGPARVVATHNLAANTGPAPAPMGPPAPEDFIASARDPFDPRDPAPPVYTPPPEPPPEQEAGPIPEDVTAQPRASSASAEAEHVRAATRGAAVAPAPAPGQAPPPASGPDYSDVAGRVASTPQQGERPDPFGHDDDPGFTRAEAIRRAGEAYAAQTGRESVPASAQGEVHREPQQGITESPLLRRPESSPGTRGSFERGGRWEEEFLANNRRIRDEEIRRRSMVIGIFGGYDKGRQARGDWRQTQQEFDQGLALARERDRAEAPISRAQAEALAATGQLSPEAAAAMRLNDPLLEQFGQFASQGGRAERLDYQRDKMMLDMHTKIALQEELLRSLKERQGMKDDTQKAVADKYASRVKAEKAQDVLTPDEKHGLVGNFLFNTYRDQGLTDEVSLEAARGVFSNVPPAIRDRVQSDTRAMNVFKTRGDFRTAAMGTTAAAAKGNTAAENAERTARATIHLKPQQIKENKEITLLAADVRRAAQAWSKMPQGARDAYVQNGRNMPEAIKSKMLGQYQAQAGDLEKLVGQIRRTTLGLAQTIPELDGLATEMGKTADTWDPFKGSQAFERSMERVLEQARLQKRLLDNLSQPRQGRE